MGEAFDQLWIREVTEQDSDLLLEWANDPAVRESAFSQGRIDAEEHKVWFARSFADKAGCYMLMAVTRDGCPVGQIRFNRKYGEEWHIDYSVAPTARGKGVGSQILQMGIRELAKARGPAKIVGWVKAENHRSRRVFERLNFEVREVSEAGDLKFERLAVPKHERLVCVATPHARNDDLVKRLSEEFSGFSFRRIVSPEELRDVSSWDVRPDWIFFPHWSWIIPEEIYGNFRCVIFHMTDLPYGRGGSPLQNLIVRGHKATKISAIVCSRGLDTGDVYFKHDLSLDGTAEEILHRASDVIEAMMRHMLTHSLVALPQEGEPTIFTRRTKADGDISSLTSPETVYDYIRMLDANGYPHAFANVGALLLEFSGAELKDDIVEAKVRIRIRNDAY